MNALMTMEWGADLIGEVLDSENEIQILRMLVCMDDNYQSLKERSIPGMAPWRSKSDKSDDEYAGEGAVYLGELEDDLRFLIKYIKNNEIAERAKDLLNRLRA